jgi:hypothetical protein
VSPRFELEAAVSRLAWLTRWVSPPELASALDAARKTLKGVPGGIGPAGKVPPPSSAAVPPPPPKAAVADSPVQFGGTGSLTEGFKRILAMKQNQGGAQGGGGPEEAPEQDAGDEPLWSRYTGGDSDTGSVPGGEPVIAPQAQRVLNVIPGTIIETGGTEHEL